MYFSISGNLLYEFHRLCVSLLLGLATETAARTLRDRTNGEVVLLTLSICNGPPALVYAESSSL
jgi:hypothetical protein